MNRIEFMAELEALLADIPAEEREEALQYYSDYFEDAGIENETHVIAELGSPQRVAGTIKEGLRGRSDESSEYRETGYADTRFENREMPAYRTTYTETVNENAPRTNKALKIFLIIAILVVAAPVVFPIALGILATVFGLMVAGFALLASFVLLAVCIVISGIITAIYGFVKLFTFPALGLVFSGIGLILTALGLVGTVLLVKLCIVLFPAMFRGIVNIFRRILYRKGKA